MQNKVTLEHRKRLEAMWKENMAPLSIAAELGFSLCTVYKELKRGQKIDKWTGEVVLDENFRPAYSAERGELQYRKNIRNRGRRSRRPQAEKGVQA